MEEKLQLLENRMKNFEEQLTITVVNGKEKQISLKDAVADIWNATEPLRDFIKVYAIFKKWKPLWITLFIAIVLLWGKSEVIELIKLIK
jgi:hypothetical protein